MKSYEILLYTERFTDYNEKSIDFLLNEIPYYDDIGYAGYSSKDALGKFLVWSIFGKEQKKWKNIDESEIRKVIENSLEACLSVIGKEPLRIFVFPTVDKFIINKMNGIAGFSPWKNTIIINIYPYENWKNSLKATVVHELAHAIALNYNERNMLKDHLVSEGIAEHFREHFASSEKSIWVKSIPEKTAFKILQEIKSFLDSEDERIYRELFFGTGKYPLWSGYAIGYYIVGSYLKKQKTIDWKELLKLPISEIIENF